VIGTDFYRTFDTVLKFGPMAFETKRHPAFVESGMPGAKEYSEDTARDIDQEVARITHETYARVKEIITTRRAVLEHLARRLLEIEVLEGTELQHLLYGHTAPEPEACLSQIPVKALDHRGAGLLVSPHTSTPVSRVALPV
jgi:Peptidase family M41